MRKNLKASLLCATVMTGLLGLAPAAGAATVAGNVSPWVAGAPKLGAAPETAVVDVAVHLNLQSLAELRAVVAQVSQPKSASYGHYLTPAAFNIRFAPAADDVAAVVRWLQGAGLQEVQAGPAGAYVTARATVAQIRSTFGVSQNLYRVRGIDLRANSEAPTVPDALAGKIAFVAGLDETSFLKKPMHRSATLDEAAFGAHGARVQAAGTPIQPPVASNLPSHYCSKYYGDTVATLSKAAGPYGTKLPWITCGYTPQQIQEAYGMNKVKLDGTGVTVAILDAYASPTLVFDSNTYATHHGLPTLTSKNFKQIVPPGIFDVSPTEPCGPQGWFVEQSLDVASVHGSAPGANIVYVGARDCGTSLDVALMNAIYKHTADIITNSYGYNGEGVPAASVAADDQAFMAAAAEGLTILFSSGDEGDLSQVNGAATGALEADSPYVTAVGGTSLALYKSNGVKNEWGWGTARDYLGGAMVNSASSVTTTGLETTSAFGVKFDAFAFYAGSGGGISLAELQPAYQKALVPAALATTLNEANGQSISLPDAHRVSPDISMVADPYTGYLIGESFTVSGNGYSDDGCVKTGMTTEYCEFGEGGTSLASPLTAGVMALVDQARRAAGKPVVGFANPLLYGLKIGATTNSGPISDVLAPKLPQANLRGYINDATRVRVVTMNSVPLVIYTAPFPVEPCASTICEGVNDVFNLTTPGFDDVTGLGVPFVPLLVKQ